MSVGEATRFGVVALSGAGTLAAIGYDIVLASFALTGTGTQTASGDRTRPAVTALTGTGTETAGGDKIKPGVSSLSGAGTQAATATRTRSGVFKSILDDAVIRLTEAGDTRVTEDGADTRTITYKYNVAEGSVQFDGVRIQHPRLAWVNVAGTWKASTIYVKYNGSWKQPLAVYKNISGSWKRVY